MQIAKDAVVTFDYILTDEAGELIDNSEDGPMVYLHGQGQIVRGLEVALLGKKVGDRVQVNIPPEDGYGEASHDKPIQVSWQDLPPGAELEEGMPIYAQGPQGQEITLYVQQVGKEGVVLSIDHPLAGVTLCFDVTIREIRAATADELAHGHAHGPDGHHHH